MEVMATDAVTLVLSSEKHPVEPRKQDVTQKKHLHQSQHILELEFIEAYSVRKGT